MGLSMHMLELEITTKCNLNCLHCYNRENKNIDMDYDDVIKYINFANKNKVHTLTLSGGEACLHPQFKIICAYLKENRNKLDGISKVTLQTNGYIRNLNLEDLQGFDYIHLSFDIDENGARNISSQKTIELAKDLESVGVKPYLFTTVHKKNLNHIDEIVKIANENNVSIEVGGQAVLGRQVQTATPWLTERHGYDPTSYCHHIGGLPFAYQLLCYYKSEAKRS